MRYRFLRFPNGKAKAVSLSYDDGCRDDLILAQVLDRYGLKCTFNVCSGFLGHSENDWRLTADEIRALFAMGHEIAIHGAFHRAPGKQSAIDGIRDVLTCRQDLEDLLGVIVRGMAYPDSGITAFMNQSSYETVRRYLSDLDIAYARTLGQDNDQFQLPDDWYSWMPTAHHDNPHIFDYIHKFLNTDVGAQYIDSRYSRLFYLWGHSFELSRNENWAHFEKICQLLSGHEDIWYATGIEIYEYVTAYNSLVFSANGNIVRNPTLHTVWFDIDGTLYSIAPGETRRLECGV